MTRFTKFALILAAALAVVLAAAVLVGQAYNFRGHFSIGGEWLVLPVLTAVAELVKEVRGVFKALYGKTGG